MSQPPNLDLHLNLVSVKACSMVAVLVHFTMFLFLTSEFLVHLDFYTAIVLPFWHEEKVASNENAATFLCVLSIIGNEIIQEYRVSKLELNF